MMIAVLCLLTLMNMNETVKTVLPLIIVFAMFDCNTSYKTYKESNWKNYDPAVVYAINNDILNQVISVQENRESQVMVDIPEFGSGGNPLTPSYAPGRVSRSFYKLGVTDYYIEILKFNPTSEKSLELLPH